MSVRSPSRIALSAGALATALAGGALVTFVLASSGCAEDPVTAQGHELDLPAGARNLARDPGTVVSAQSTYPGYSAQKVVDGNTSTALGGASSWANAHDSAANGRLPQWFQVELAEARQIEGINLYTTSGYQLKSFDIDAWDGTSWRTLVQTRDNHQNVVSYSVTPFKASKIRVTCLSGPNNQSIYARLNELEIIGRDGAEWTQSVLEAGEGWKLVRLAGTDDNGAPAVQEDLAILDGAGAATAPLPQSVKDDLAGAAPDDVFVVSASIAGEIGASEAAGELTPRLLALAEAEGGGSAVAGARGSCSDQLVTKSKSLSYSGPYSHAWNLASGLTGSVNVSGGASVSGNAELRFYKKRKKVLWACIPYAARFDGASISGSGQVTQGATLTGSVSYSHDWEWDVAKINLGGFLFFVGPVPIYLDFKLPIVAGLELEANASGPLQYNGSQAGTGSFNLTCKPGAGCSGTGGWNLTAPPGQPLLSTALEARVKATPWVDVALRVSLYHEDFVFVQGGLRPKLKTDLWGYRGDLCGDADQNGAGDAVRALTVDLDGELHVTARAAFLKTVAAGSWDLFQWSRHILFRNLLSDTSAFQPLVAGPAAAQVNVNQSYAVTMRPCWPYSDKVNYELTANGTTTPLAGNAHTATSLGITFPALGPAPLSARALRDAHGRDLGATSARTIDVVAQAGTWTAWLERDNPFGAGDYETRADFFAAGLACAQPLAVRCQTTAGVDWSATGQVYTCSPTVGGVCVNALQPAGQSCLDYRVQFLCP
jgi:hypothetical protein